MSNYRPAKKQIDVSVGESVRIIRELQGMSQNEVAKLSGIPQSTISAIENDRINLGSSGPKRWHGFYSAIRPCWCFQAGKLSMNLQLDNSFKPNPLRGSDAKETS